MTKVRDYLKENKTKQPKTRVKVVISEVVDELKKLRRERRTSSKKTHTREKGERGQRLK